MAQPNVDLCNPLSIFEALIQFLTGASPSATPPVSSRLPTTLQPPLLYEPDYEVRPQVGSSRFELVKPNYGVFDAQARPSTPVIVIQSFATRGEAEAMKSKLPRVRLPGRFLVKVETNGSLTPLPVPEQFNWTADADAQACGRRLQDMLTQMPIFATLPAASQVALNVARLSRGTPASHIIDPKNANHSFVMVDPFQIKSVAELAAVYIHELTHGQYYHRRGFNPTELVMLLTRDDYLLVALDEELACYKNEANAIQQFIAAAPSAMQGPFRDWMDFAIRPPASVYFSQETASIPPPALDELVHEIIGRLNLDDFKRDYDSTRTAGTIVLSPAASTWVSSSEWAAIQATRVQWQRAGQLP
jgi:hypothetical protein